MYIFPRQFKCTRDVCVIYMCTCVRVSIHMCTHRCLFRRSLPSSLTLHILRCRAARCCRMARSYVSPRYQIHCNTLQYPAPNCETLHHTAPRCTTLHHTATHCNTLQHNAPRCKALHHAAPRCTTLQHTATQCTTVTHCTTLHRTATLCITLQHTAKH